MANIKELKTKIKSTKGTLKITSAMKLVSASKLARAQGAIQGSRPYVTELEETIKTVSALVDNYSHPYMKEKNESRDILLLVFSSNKGLCGGYNAQLSKEVRKFVEKSDYNIAFSYIGKKVRELMKDFSNEEKYYEPSSAELSFQEVTQIGKELAKYFISEKYSKVFVAYNKFNSAISFTPTVKQILPLTLDQEEKEVLREKFPFDFKYEPSAQEILDVVIPEVFMSTVWNSYLEALASEHGSRMSAMDSAVSNCKDAIRTQTIKMNKLRQAAITTELIEVVSGAESLNA